MANQICNADTTTHNPTNAANIVNTGSYKARLTASIYPWDKSTYVSKLSQVKHLILSLSSLFVTTPVGGITSLGSAPGIFTSGWLAIFLFLSFPIQSFALSSDYQNRFFDKDYANSVWENYPTPRSFSEYSAQNHTPEIQEAYSKWHKQFKRFYKSKTQESLDYLSQEPLGEEIKKFRDTKLAYNTWEEQFKVYARCVQIQYLSKKPFLIFEDFQKAKAIYVSVDCNNVGPKCSEYSNEGRYEEIGQCKTFPDWRYEEGTKWVGRYTTYEKDGIHGTLPD